MTRFRWLIPISLMLVLAVAVAVACGGDGDDEGGVTQTPRATADAPTPHSTESQTDSPTAVPDPVEEAYELVQTMPSATFDNMLGFSLIPGAANEGVVVTQGGVIYRVPLSVDGTATVFGDVSDRVIDYRQENEGGLLGLAISPAFETDRRVYLYFTSNDCDRGADRCDVLARYTVANDTIDPESEEVLLEVADPYENHNGGQLAFGPDDGYLYLALGDGGAGGDPHGNGQDLSTLLATILRLDVSGSGYDVPPDNPFVSMSGARPEIYAYGLRNAWRFSFDRATGDLWAADVGQDKWEEVDRIVAGGNYGWNVMEGLECFGSSGCDTNGLRLPRAVYGRDGGCSVTGGYVYRGPSMPELNGWYVYGDFCSGMIWAVNTADDSPPVLLADTGLEISSFGELPDGELLVLTFNNAVYRLQRGES